ncbi:MAG: DUF1292 domain-containing protein [Erysipelotrichaceae bacterium]|nr:DUF1292 domain-containing protein [Erysipelotrichaceae bacterium]MDD3923753.1 DUF1292 domain-containing protein [Erysipelotrichaceae bacterium]MDD4642325.1 DUF1292 domain-containing protein [Erysipelotrichaceae bacterium]
MDTNKMFIIDDNGNEVEVDILFTFESEEYGKKYVLYQDPNGDEEEVFVSSYDDEGNLEPVEEENELAMVEEVLGAFVDEKEKEA